MMTRTSTRHYLARTLLLAFLVATFAVGAVQSREAAAQGDRFDELAYTNTMTQIQVCEAMGGHAEVHTVMNAAGRFASVVTCRGGAMDGFQCTNDRYGTLCTWVRTIPGGGRGTLLNGDLTATDIASLDEPTPTSPVVSIEGSAVEQPAGVAPDVQELPATPTPEPSPIVTVVDPVLSDPVVTNDGATATPTPDTGGEIISDPVITDPVVNDGAVAPIDSSDGTIITDPAPVRDPLKHLPVGGEEIKVAPGQ